MFRQIDNAPKSLLKITKGDMLATLTAAKTYPLDKPISLTVSNQLFLQNKHLYSPEDVAIIHLGEIFRLMLLSRRMEDARRLDVEKILAKQKVSHFELMHYKHFAKLDYLSFAIEHHPLDFQNANQYNLLLKDWPKPISEEIFNKFTYSMEKLGIKIIHPLSAASSK